MARNPKDVIVSYYHHHRLIKLHDFTGSLDEFAQYFMDDKGILNHDSELIYRNNINTLLSVLSSPFFGHILEAWALRNHPNMLFLFYEDMKKAILYYFLFIISRKLMHHLKYINRIYEEKSQK